MAREQGEMREERSRVNDPPREGGEGLSIPEERALRRGTRVHIERKSEGKKADGKIRRDMERRGRGQRRVTSGLGGGRIEPR